MITDRDIFRKGRVTARAKNTATANESKTGLYPLQLDGLKDGFIYVPEGYNDRQPALLAVMLHGAGGEAEHGLQLLSQHADEHNIILLAPASRAATWDVIFRGTYGADVIFIDQALTLVFEKYNIDTAHIAIGGFSDGASYALCLGLSNGDLFTHIIAFSPGFYNSMENHGKPLVFISHGVNDQVLPIAPCSRRIVPRLKRSGYMVEYQEFEGRHEVPAAISGEAVEWFAEPVAKTQ